MNMNSVLNPEAPEFYPHLSSVTKNGYTSVNKSIRASNQLPLGASYDLFKTFTDFNLVTSQLSDNVITQSNNILSTELAMFKLKRNDPEHNTEKIADTNDSLLDRININIDTLTGVNKPNENVISNDKNKIIVSSWNNKPVIAKIQMGSTTLFGAKNIPRPQILFKDTIDNSENLWVPKISDKPNNIKPLALNIIYNNQGEAVGFEHPYKIELDLYHPPLEFIDPDPEPPVFPQTLDNTPYTYIDNESQLDELVKHLDGVKEIAVDVEHHSYRTYQGITCLLQITTESGGDFIIDTLAAREHIHKLNLAFTDPKKVKVFHGADRDVNWLQRDFGVYIVGLFDTYQAAKVLKLQGLSLKYLLMKYCSVDADKKYQLADWRIRPLPDELIEYARSDTHYLLYIYKKMKADLLEAGAGQPQLLLSVYEQSRHVCGLTYTKDVTHDKSHMSLYIRSKKSFNSQQLSALSLLYKWRDSQARQLDESTTYLIPNHMLIALAENLPREIQGVSAICNPSPPFVKQNLITIHRMLLSCRGMPVEPQLYQMPASISEVLNATPQFSSYNIHDLSQQHYRDDQSINLDQAELFFEQFPNYQPDIPAFTTNYNETELGVVSDLNVEAKMFIPPFDRYRKYRAIAQIEELKEFKDKEAKIAAISHGNELIKAEVLAKLQQATTHIENSDEPEKSAPSTSVIEILDDSTNEVDTTKRKRKISSKSEKKERVSESIDLTQSEETVTKKINYKNNAKHVKPYQYKNVDYKKFYDESEKGHKQTKKFKKRKS